MRTAPRRSGGVQLSVSGLVGVVEDADRLLVLLGVVPGGGSPDRAAFSALLEQAYEAQVEALD